MSLISFFYVLYLPIVVCVNFIIPKKFRYVWLLAASFCFYLSNGLSLAAGLLFCTATVYLAGLLLGRTEGTRRKWVMLLCVLLNVAMMLAFRYTALGSALLSLGMSFYTLQALGYVVDVYQNRTEAEKNPLRLALYVAFFPTILAGPIQRSVKLLPQIREGRDFDYEKAHSGLYYLLWGYLLKLVMADQLGAMVDHAYTNYADLPGAALLWATALYAVQLYCDFAGYSALAIGTGKILGFDFGENFTQPYFSTSIRDFWNRWHISLSSWLRDYIYIPLGGNRKGKLRKCLNLMITFMVSGLWHGSGLNFLVWGGLHGIYQTVAGLFPKREPKRGLVRRLAGMLFTFVLVDFAWLFFRADSLGQAWDILRRIFGHFGLREMTYYGSYMLGGTKLRLLLTLLGVAAVFLIDFLHEKKISVERFAMSRVNIVVRWTAYVALTLLILLVAVRNYGQAASTFIYTRF